ncbi:hypothetical protein L7F22_058569 [Adiantum nelumboides]|nr:hypothetical protein [Adiantum nelumboides]
MRGVAESRSLALSITRRARGPSYSRNFSAGIGRGRGGGFGKYDDADEPLFGSSLGHGTPKGGPSSGRGGPLNSASSSPGAPFGGSSAGRGFNNLNQHTETHSLNNAPLFANVSFGRGSVNRNQGEDPFSDAKLPQGPALNLGSGSFGRGKPAENIGALPEDIFSSDHKALSSWSRWDQKLTHVDTKGAPSATEMRLLEDERFSSVSPRPAIPQQQLGQLAWNSPASASPFEIASSQQRPPSPSALQSPGTASPLQAAPPHQRPPSPPAFPPSGSTTPLQAASPQQRASSPLSREPIQQSNFVDQVPTSYTSPSAGWQQPAQQPYQDIRFQPGPSTQNAPPPTGWQQPVQQPYNDARVQPQPIILELYLVSDFNLGWQQPVQQPYHDARVQPQLSLQFTPPPTGWQQQTVQQPNMYYTPPPTASQPPASTSPFQATNMQQRPPSGPPGWQQQTVQQPNIYYTPPPTASQPPASTSPFQATNMQQRPPPGPPGWQQQTVQPKIHYTTPPIALQTPASTSPSQATYMQQRPPLGPPGWQQQTFQQPNTYYTPPPTVPGLQPPASTSHSQATNMPQRPPPGPPGRLLIQDFSGKSSQLHGAFLTDDWQPSSSGDSMHLPQQSFDPAQPFAKLHQVSPYGGESVEPPLVAPTSSVDGSGYNSTNGHMGLDYEGKIDELYKQNKLDEIDDIYCKMKAAQIRAGAKTYGTMLQSYLQLGKMDKVAMIYKEMSGVLFAGDKSKDEVGKGTSTASRVESLTPNQIGGAASSTETHGAGKGTQVETRYKEDGEITFSRSMDTPSSGIGSQSFPSFGQPEPSVGRGMGRGLNVEGHGVEPSVGRTPLQTLSSSQGTQSETKYEEAEEPTFAKIKDIPPPPFDTGAKSFTLSGQSDSNVGRGMGRGMKVERHGSEPSVGTGRGRGKKVDSFFNFNFSGGLDSADQGVTFGKPSLQLDEDNKAEMKDEYSQTFIPVIQPEWYAFAPEGLSVGPGAGRGRPQSPQARGVGLQQAPPLYSLDSRSVPAGPQFADPEEEEPLELPLSAEEAEAAAERAMEILTEMRVNKFKNYFEFDDKVVKRSPLGLARSLREREQPKMSEKMEETVQLTEEEQKKKAERLKVIEENEALQGLHHTFDQFMKFYGEMAIEPEHELGDFTNPDIEEKPFMSLEEYLEKAKPNIMKTGLISNEKQWQTFRDEGRCFFCGEKGHMKPDCPQRQRKKESAPPSSNSIPDVQGNTDQEKGKRQLLKGWGSLNNQRVLILYDPGSTENFISLDTANCLNLSTDKLGTPVTSGSAFEGLTTNCPPVQEKLNLRIGMYKDRESFLMAPIEGCDVILGMPWHYRIHPIPDFVEKTLTLPVEDKKIIVYADADNWSYPLVSHISVKKELKKKRIPFYWGPRQ